MIGGLARQLWVGHCVARDERHRRLEQRINRRVAVLRAMEARRQNR